MNRIVVALAVAMTASVTPALAQLQAMPVFFSPKGGTGLTVSGDFGRAVTTRVNGTSSAQKPAAFGAGVRLGLPIITVGLSGAIYDPQVTTQGNEAQYAGTLSAKVFGGGLIPIAISVQGGAGYLKQGSGTFATKSLSIPVGIGVAINVPTPGASIEPWVAGRVQLNSVVTGSVSGSQIGYGASGGLSLGMPMGLGAHFAMDWVTLPARPSSPVLSQRNKVERFTVGGGVHFSIKIPGLPGIPIL